MFFLTLRFFEFGYSGFVVVARSACMMAMPLPLSVSSTGLRPLDIR